MENILYNMLVAAGVAAALGLLYYGGKWILLRIASINIIGNCGHCGASIKKNEAIRACPSCSAKYHSQCYEIHGGCTCEDSNG